MNVIEIDHQNLRLLLHDPEDGVMLNRERFTAYHNHHYGEIHIIVSGEGLFTIEDEEKTVHEHDAILIPANAFHSVEMRKECPERIVFYADCQSNHVVCKSFPGELIAEIRTKLSESSDIRHVYNHLFFILNELFDARRYRISHLNDDLLQIKEFFSHHYNKDIRLSDLAKVLHLSEMQTQRVTKKYTGMTFGENLLLQRMTVAENLRNRTKMSMREISEYVGYRSYCGFWKAYKKYQTIKEKDKT